MADIWQTYGLEPTGLLLALILGIIFYRISLGSPILLPGILGVALSVVLGSQIGQVRAGAQIVEIGFIGHEYYMQSALDLGKKRPIKLYPLDYSSPHRVPGYLWIHYIERHHRLPIQAWPDAPLIWEHLVSSRL